MITFQKVKLGDIAYDERNTYLPSAVLEIPYIGLEHIEQQTLRLSSLGKSSDIMSQKKKFVKGNVLYGSLRPYFRKVFKPNFDGVCSTDITVIKPKSNCSNSYLFYLIASQEFILKASSAGTGTKMPRAGWKVVKDFVFDVPDLSTQTLIGLTISKYDDLVENNEKRIKILEEMAQLLYTEWFVKFKFPGHEKIKMVNSKTSYGMIPEGWEVKKLGDVIQIKKGKNITKDTIIKGDIPVVAGGIEPAYYHNIPNTISPVITISASGAGAGFTKLYYQDIWASDCSYIDKNITEYVYFFYLFLKNKQKEISNLQRGSAQPHVYPKDLMGLKIIDSQDFVNEFNDFITPLFELIDKLKDKNIILTKTRDLLIPQLVTGKRELKN